MCLSLWEILPAPPASFFQPSTEVNLAKVTFCFAHTGSVPLCAFCTEKRKNRTEAELEAEKNQKIYHDGNKWRKLAGDFKSGRDW